MRTASLYALTAEICNRVLTDVRPADAQIAKFFRDKTFLGARDRRFISDTMYALVRHKRALETIAGAANASTGSSFHGAVALLAAYVATGGMDRPEDHDAAFAEAAKCSPEAAAAFTAACASVNVDDETMSPAARLALHQSFPDWLVERFIAERGMDEAAHLCESLNTQAPITLRVNELQTTVDACLAELTSEGTPAESGTIIHTAVRLQKRVNIFQSPVFKKGWFEMQDEGSQAISVFTDPHPNWRVLDACAGAGGKTLHLAALMKNKGEIFALTQNEFQEAELRRRLRRAGAQNVRVLCAPSPDVIAKFAGTMHVVLIDAPCSGTGTLRRNPVAKWRLTEERVHQYAAAQLAIMEQYMDAVRPNGKLVYATCSVLREENADVVAAFLAKHPQFTPDARGSRTAETNALRNPDGTLELLPHRNDTDGFFAAALTRTA